MIKTMAELLAPQISELDAMAVDVYGLKSKAADDMAKDERWSIESVLANTGGENIFGQEVAPLTEEDLLGMVMGTTGGPMGSSKGLLKGLFKKGKNLFKESNVADVSKLGKKTGDFLHSGKTFKIKSGGEARDITTVAVRNADGSISHQPFYKSSGTSQRSADMVKRGELAERAGTWEPFLGRTEKGGFYKMGSNTGRYSKEMKPGWWVKGWREGADDYRIAQSKRGVKDIDARMGPMKEVSDEIARLDKLGYFQSAGSVKGATQKPVNKWLEGYGFNRVRSESPFR